MTLEKEEEHRGHLLNWGVLIGHTGVDSNNNLELIPKSTSLHHAEARLRGKITGPSWSSKPREHLGSNTILRAVFDYKEQSKHS